MPRYEVKVEVQRDYFTFIIDAEDEDEAEDRAMTMAEENASVDVEDIRVM